MARAPFLVVFKAPRADSHGPGRRPLLFPGESRPGPWGEGPGAPDSTWTGGSTPGPQFSFSHRGPWVVGVGNGLGAASGSSRRPAEGLAPRGARPRLRSSPPSASPTPGPPSGPPGALPRLVAVGSVFPASARRSTRPAGLAGGLRRPPPRPFSLPEPPRPLRSRPRHERDVSMSGTGAKGRGGRRAGCKPRVF